MNALVHRDYGPLARGTLMRDGRVFTNATYRSRFLLDSRVATQELRDLVRRGLVQRDGAGRWTTYRLAMHVRVPAVPEVGERPATSGPSAVLRVLADEPELSRAEIAARLNASNRNVLAWLRRLQDATPPLVMRYGPLRSPKASYGLTAAGRSAARAA